jgi:hypothetical protein
MKLSLAFLSVLFACGVSLQTSASARPFYGQYCLEYADGGGTIIDCSYATMGQCWASKTGPADQCYFNPRLMRRGY